MNFVYLINLIYLLVKKNFNSENVCKSYSKIISVLSNNGNVLFVGVLLFVSDFTMSIYIPMHPRGPVLNGKKLLLCLVATFSGEKLSGFHSNGSG